MLTTTVNGRIQCKTAQCNLILGCYECDINNKCISCTDPTHKVKDNGLTCSPGACPQDTYEELAFLSLTPICKPCPIGCL
jgi:hypothetical protein